MVRMLECGLSLVEEYIITDKNRYYLQHIVHSVQTRLSSKSDGLPQSEIYEEEFGNVKLNSGMVPEILLP